MPWIEKALSDFNQALALPNRGELDVELFAPGQPIKAALHNAGVRDQRLWGVLADWPESVAEAFKAAIYSGLTRDDKGPITVAWVASYDYGIEIHESKSFDGSAAGITIILRTRYPFDRHPTAASRA